MIIHRRAFLKRLGLGAAGLTLVPTFRLSAETIHARLPRTSPEEQGVSSAGILAFIEAVGKSRHEFHGFMMARHGRVIAEGWWTPYRAALNHMLYSLSKSFTSTAVGLAVTEGRLKVDDTVISFFPDKLPAQVSDNLAALRVKHLLMMSVGHAKDSTPIIVKEHDWVKSFLGLPIAYAPGSVFLYNSGATYMLSAIVQKVSGQKVLDYLRPRLFGPLDVRGMTWETCPLGINTGGWDLRFKRRRSPNLRNYICKTDSGTTAKSFRRRGFRKQPLSKSNSRRLLEAIWKNSSKQTTGIRATATNSGAAGIMRSAAMAPTANTPS
jgi:CubicO group peptidase (beta-lactamase class C family)